MCELRNSLNDSHATLCFPSHPTSDSCHEPSKFYSFVYITVLALPAATSNGSASAAMLRSKPSKTLDKCHSQQRDRGNEQIRCLHTLDAATSSLWRQSLLQRRHYRTQIRADRGHMHHEVGKSVWA